MQWEIQQRDRKYVKKKRIKQILVLKKYNAWTKKCNKELK